MNFLSRWLLLLILAVLWGSAFFVYQAKGHLAALLATLGIASIGAVIIVWQYRRYMARAFEQLQNATSKTTQSEEHLRALVAATVDAIIEMDETGRILLANEAAHRMFGWPAGELVGRAATELMRSEDRHRHKAGLQRYMETGESKLIGKTTEVIGCRKDGALITCDYSLAVLKEPGETQRFIGIMRDITERKEVEKSLKLFRGLLDHVRDSIEVIDPQTGRFVNGNEKSWSNLGYARNELFSLTVPDIDPLITRTVFTSNMQRLRETGETLLLESIHRRKDGTTFPVEVSAQLIQYDKKKEYVVAIVRDITERKRLEDQFRQAQKMEAVGQLTGGFAHDFNNLLTVINGYCQILLTAADPGDPKREELEQIKVAGERAANLTCQLLAFSRRQILQLRVVDLNALVTNLDKMLQRVLSEDIELKAALSPNLGGVKADQCQIEQVLMNLAVNARDAMPDGGKLTIETANVELDDAYARERISVKPGPYVLLAVSDTGCGMDAETQKRIFEPFFTTKEPGKGTGLGLSTVYGIVKQSGGYVWVYSEPSQGTTFKIYLPRVDERVETVEPVRLPVEMLRGTETVLLVEDDAGVRALARGVLKSGGYTLLEASNGVEALRVAEQHDDTIHLLVSDVVMSGMSGRQLGVHLVAMHPTVKTLYMSGYADSTIVHDSILEPGLAFLQKPFMPDALLRKVREVLDAPAKEAT
jgi:two-component system cell cycle sensor histidine kinase/response regulator CckA